MSWIKESAEIHMETLWISNMKKIWQANFCFWFFVSPQQTPALGICFHRNRHPIEDYKAIYFLFSLSFKATIKHSEPTAWKDKGKRTVILVALRLFCMKTPTKSYSQIRICALFFLISETKRSHCIIEKSNKRNDHD